MTRRYHCMACRCDEVEIVVAPDGAHESTFVCFECQHVLYFMADAAPRPRELALFELYRKPTRR